ncbi:uncharacterized protein LOC129583094 [Paramacrobiotus metropolitanus]|uniref:uncharacterized protein LOC129583094 n=1 Tax=Paramacrobiotus metropolitanus TaxID=2943436 RepID=UPI0024462068|nr:uncharacterized protein LOC129583094 [Paramacrobiotus metropolitanus]
MEVHVRELFPGRWMEDKSGTVDIDASIENGKSVGIVRVDLQSTLADLRLALNRQFEAERVPANYAFVERLGKQLVEIWQEEEALLRVKDLVGRDPEILIVETTGEPGASRKGKRQRKASNANATERPRSARDSSRRQQRGGRNRKDSNQRRDRRPSYADFPEDETRFYYSDNSRSNRNSGRARWSDERERTEDRSRSRRRSQSRKRRGGGSTFRRRYSKSVEPRLRQDDSDPDIPEEDRDRMDRERPGTVRIRKEQRVTKEVIGDEGRVGVRLPVKRSMLKKSVSVEDLRSATSSTVSDLDGFRTADSVTMDDYFLDRPALSYSALNLRELEKDPVNYRKKFETSKMERRLAGLFGKVRGIEEKTALLKNIGEEHWRGRFLQLRRNTLPLEERVKELEEEEAELMDNLVRLFELRKPIRYELYGDYRKNAYILQAQRLQNDMVQLNNQIENIDLDLLKYRKMRKLAEEQTQGLARDIQREKFLRHLLLGRTLAV